MSDLNDFLKLMAEAKAKDPKHQAIKQIKEAVKEDVNNFFNELTAKAQVVDNDEKSETDEEIINDIPVLENEETQAQELIDNHEAKLQADVLNLLKKREEAVPFQQPNPDIVSKDIKAIIEKLKFMEQWLGRISATGPGSGEVNLRYLDDVDTSGMQNGYALVYNQSTDKFEFVDLRAESAILDTGEPMGHVNKLESSISFNNSTRVFSISPVAASFSIYTRGVKRTISETRTVTLPATTGLYYIYFDTDGILQYKTDFFNFETDCMTAYIYWNQSESKAVFFADERHGIVLDWQTHEYLHRTRGASFASGFAATNYILNGDGSSNNHAHIDLSGGTFFDEDLQVDIIHSLTPSPNTWEQILQTPARIPMMYHTGAYTWNIDTPTEYPLKRGTTLPIYNQLNGGSWTTSEIQNNKFGVTFILATNNLNYPIIGILGQASYDTIAQAQAVDYNELSLQNLPVFELRPLYRVIYACKNTYTNEPKAAIVEVKDLRKDLSIQVI